VSSEISSCKESSVSMVWASLDRLGASWSGGDLTGDLAVGGFFAIGESGAWAWLREDGALGDKLVAGETTLESLLITRGGLDSGFLIVVSFDLEAALPNEVILGGELGGRAGEP
jgi:hypothetical protein